MKVGISTSNNSKFSEQLEKDCETVLNSIKNKKNSKIIEYCKINKKDGLRYAFLQIQTILIRILGKIFEFKGFLNTTNDFFDNITK